MDEKRIKVALVKSHGRVGYGLRYWHPVEKTLDGKPLRIHRGLGTKDEQKAIKCVDAGIPALPPRPLERRWSGSRHSRVTLSRRQEHKKILSAERSRERNLFYQLLWEIGVAQSDAAHMKAEQIDWGTRSISFQRMKTASWSHIIIGKSLVQILKELPSIGFLFPSLAALNKCKMIGC